MAISIKDFRMAIRIDNSEASAKFKETQEQLKQVAAEMQKLNESGKKNTAEYRALKKQQDELNTSLYRQRLEGGKATLTYNELRKGASQLRRAMDNLRPGSEEWKKYREELQLTRQRMRELQGTATQTSLSIGKIADGFNRYAAFGASAIASATGLTLTMRQCVDEYAKMEEAESQVIKYTGMTREETKQLNEEFKQMDTRTPREELNRLAGDAGKLGITGVENVREFVEAADMINVALGEDLGEEAVNQIGKLSQMFGDESRSLKENMLATGSAVNQVAQNTSASEPYLVEFTARMGGVGKQAGMAVTDIIGFASALDQNMLRSEMASTALSGLIMRIYQEPAKYAKLAGMDVQQFTQLVQDDVNQAVLAFLESLNKMGGMAQIAPVLKEMKLSGAEAASVITTLAGNIGLVRKEQANANQAFREGASITNEYNVQNNTVQAQLEKTRKRFQEVRIELGERLQPVMKNMISFGSLTVKGLLELVRVFGEYKGTIAGAAAGLAAYFTYQKLYVALTKLSDLWTTRFNRSLKVLGKTMMTNMWGLAITGIGAFMGYLYQARRESVETTETLRGMKKVARETGDAFAQQVGKIRALSSVVNDSAVALDTRREALEKLKEIVPDYNAMLTDEGTLTNNNTEAIKAYLVQLEKQIKMKAAMEELENLYKEQRQLEKQESEQSDEYWDIRQQNTLQGYDRNSLTARISRAFGTSKEDRALKKLEETRERLKGIRQDIEDINTEIGETSIAIDKIENDNGDSGGSTGGTGDDYLQTRINEANAKMEEYLQARIAALEQQYREEVNLLKAKYLGEELTQEEANLLKEKYLLDEKITQEDYQRQMAASEMAYLEMRKSLMMKAGQDVSALQGQIYDKMIAEAERRREEELKQEEEWFREQDALVKEANAKMEEYRKDEKEKGLAAVRAETDPEKQLDMLQAMYDADLISYEDYQRMKDEIAEGHENGRMEKAEQAMQAVSRAAQAASQVVQALQDRETSKVEAKYDKEIAAAKKAGKDTTQLEEEKEAALLEVKKKYADKQFAMNVLQILADTAVAIMKAYVAAGNPILGAVYAAIIAAQGAAQVVVAKQQRDEAKGLYEGGYAQDYIQGYTAKGNPHDVAGIIPVHKNEFVANHEAVANPHVKQFLDVFDIAQKRGTIRLINTTQILEQARIRQGRYQGGYAAGGAGAPAMAGAAARQDESRILGLLEENNRLLAVLTKKELVVDSRQVRDGIKRVEQLERNVSR